MILYLEKILLHHQIWQQFVYDFNIVRFGYIFSKLMRKLQKLSNNQHFMSHICLQSRWLRAKKYFLLPCWSLTIFDAKAEFPLTQRLL